MEIKSNLGILSHLNLSARGVVLAHKYAKRFFGLVKYGPPVVVVALNEDDCRNMSEHTSARTGQNVPSVMEISWGKYGPLPEVGEKIRMNFWLPGPIEYWEGNPPFVFLHLECAEP